LIKWATASKRAAVIDVGGGASTLADDLLEAGYDDVTVLDIAEPALAVVQERLGSAVSKVRWVVADFLEAELEAQRYDVCHDRAVFHFLNSDDDRKKYFAQVNRILRPGGMLVVATFALGGPKRCSGLSVSRYDEAAMKQTAGEGFVLVGSRRESHRTPLGSVQEMMYFVLRRSESSPAR
jgi:ubiquinone/menaquinone biosynthesis C-methylase UbiE